MNQIDAKFQELLLELNRKSKQEVFNKIKENYSKQTPDIKLALENAKNTKQKPTVIIANTIKGKGVSFMENNAGWHGSAPSKEQRDLAISELEGLRKGY